MSELSDCPTCSIPMPEHCDYECTTCGLMASEHISITSMCKVLCAVSNREASLIVKVNKLLRLIDAALTQYDLGGEIEPETRHDLALAVDGREP